MVLLQNLDKYRISLFSRWKQRGMYAACMWSVQLLLVLSKMDSIFCYIPEFYVEALVYINSSFLIYWK
ncbi:E3 ubiquitin-protein ligase RKP [Vitis vinifera]|uniref:E3 ubiquitin-protein ligase RKP n=1 Tax=Vitis vinifera TaxID=29760 RepID=A0A438KJZ9_VITVI|nr:E3 ubiquitin-protein ligase RKP [Vitis vinifera]